MKSEPLILAIETALPLGSLCLLRGENPIASVTGEKNVSRAEDLMGFILILLENNNLKLREIDLIAVSEGPGSFTGIRIGMATAKALATGSKIPLLGVSVLKALAFSCQTTPVISIVRGVRDTVYWQRFEGFRGGSEEGSPQVSRFDDILELEKDRGAGKGVSTIILDPSLRTRFDSQAFKPKEPLKFIYASDNAAKFIALFSLYSIKHRLPSREPIPNYFLEAEIGGQRQ